ncbi:LysR family transcriptional regulator ArgP [Massilia sp. TS11]|uniref:LysR family transcriptional regulator ArgP n=1 Tax=Massilia sp. TS11 TaxID=2908003 RepID=UPI0035A3AB4A
MLDFRKGEAFLAVIDSGSFDQAAAQLHLTPSAVSQRVSQLEMELGMTLVVRGKPCRATQDGQRLLQYLRRARLLSEEFQADTREQPLRLALAVNHDTLATWLLPGLADFLARERLLLDLALDDQDHTYQLLAEGRALAAISTAAEPMRGGVVEALGRMRYRLLAAPAFAQRWFPKGLEREAARRAPLLVFDRKDSLQARFLEQELGLPPGSVPCHYIPASEPFARAIALGIGYGMLPDQQVSTPLHDLAPGRWIDVPLYWHAWRVQSPALERLAAQVRALARASLLPLGD